MGAADEQIRVSETVKQEIERRRREGESYNDVLERLFSPAGDRDFLAGFGRWSDERADRARKALKNTKRSRKSGYAAGATTHEGSRRDVPDRLPRRRRDDP
ncbi:hypothetical protein BRD07_06385 [Halobacteriales archaeon QS_9_68_42]|nr:MAG: hypothetical protein BRD07_06385 [Halobacteriales archaeon QS_9_68_42]